MIIAKSLYTDPLDPKYGTYDVTIIDVARRKMMLYSVVRDFKELTDVVIPPVEFTERVYKQVPKTAKGLWKLFTETAQARNLNLSHAILPKATEKEAFRWLENDVRDLPKDLKEAVIDAFVTAFT